MTTRKFLLVISMLLGFSCFGQQQDQDVFRNPSAPLEARINDLISKLTLEEKALQMMHRSPAIPRLNIPAYNWWNESLHGVARSGVATVFPQAIGLGATFDEDLIFRIGNAISDEARAMHNASVAKGHRLQYSGLTFWTPNINIFRDPRWGRGQETYGEDPFLTATLGMALVKGLQGNHPSYLKVAACAKHFAVHSGPERLRHEFNAVASPKDLRETYLPAFKALVDNGVETVMCAYNATNGEPCCSNQYLLKEVLRDEWGFKGHVVSDCWALVDLYQENGHKTVATQAEAVALAVKRGVNLNCGDEFPALVEAVNKGLITEKEIDAALAVLLKTRFRLGLFDPAENNPYNKIGTDVIDSEAHRALAKEAALKSIVLLKNNGALPLKNDLPRYFVTGPNAEGVYALMGNYYGVNPNMVTFLEGIAAAIQPGSQLQYKPGVELDRANVNPIDWTTGDAKASDVTFVVMGLTGMLEGEEGESIASPHYGDRLDYDLPKAQIDFLKKLRDGNPKPIIAIVTGGSPMNLSEVHELADAVLLVWYAGEEGGNAVADILFGKASPSGKLPITFPKSLAQLPPYEDY
jgi:beta-glucosidase